VLRNSKREHANNWVILRFFEIGDYFPKRSNCICRGVISCRSGKLLGSVRMAKALSKAIVSANNPIPQVSRKLFKKNWLSPNGFFS